MESYTTIGALLAPVIKGDLQPLSGRYLIRLAQGRRVVALSSSVRSGLVTLVGLASCCMSSVIFLTLPSRATKSGRDRLERRQDLPVEAFYAPGESALSKVDPDDRKNFFYRAFLQVASAGYTAGGEVCFRPSRCGLFVSPYHHALRGAMTHDTFCLF